MSKMFLVKSDHEREDIGDIIINLDKILTIRSAIKNDEYVLVADYTSDDHVRAWFRSKENLIATLKSILVAMDSDPNIADEYVLMKDRGNDKTEKVLSALKELKGKLENIK